MFCVSRQAVAEGHLIAAGPSTLRCLKRVLYPRTILSEGWWEVVLINETHWADEDLDYGEFSGVPVGGLIEGP